VEFLSRLDDRAPGSAHFAAALQFLVDELDGLGFTVERFPYPSRSAEFLLTSGEALEDISDLSILALAYDARRWDGLAETRPVRFQDARGGRQPGGCVDGVAVLRLAGDAEVPMVQDVLGRCAGTTPVVLGIHAQDAAWARITASAASVRLPVVDQVLATNHAAQLSAHGAPWLIVTPDSSGPGASQSAAPAAVLLEVARQAVAWQFPLRIAVASSSDGSAVSLLLKRLAALDSGPMIWLGPMGARVAVVLGADRMDEPDQTSTSAGLLAVGAVDGEWGDWLARAMAPQRMPTSPTLLASISGHLGVLPGSTTGLAGWPLAAGLDAAWLGEPEYPTIGPPSIAGTAVDTADQITAADLDRLSIGLAAALEELRRETE
jgi:hypothetical protein